MSRRRRTTKTPRLNKIFLISTFVDIKIARFHGRAIGARDDFFVYHPGYADHTGSTDYGYCNNLLCCQYYNIIDIIEDGGVMFRTFFVFHFFRHKYFWSAGDSEIFC
jgi:hypothetical protein